MKLNNERLKARVERARSVVGAPITYELGRGGYVPSDDSPAQYGGCDCSGFAAWCLWLSRKPKPSRNWWIETTNIYRDATGPKTTFTKIERPVPGCLIVYGDKGRKQGHVAVVSSATKTIVMGIDCSPGNERRSGSAIAQRKISWMMNRGAIFAVLTEDVAQ